MVRGPEARPRLSRAWPGSDAVPRLVAWAVSCVVEGDLEIREVERAFA